MVKSHPCYVACEKTRYKINLKITKEPMQISKVSDVVPEAECTLNGSFSRAQSRDNALKLVQRCCSNVT